ISRLAVGWGTNLTDGYRALRKAGGFFQLTNSFYWKQIQLDFKRDKTLSNGDKVELQQCGCQPPIDFPTPPSPRATPLAPPQSPKNIVQFGFYYSVPGRATEPDVKLRVRLTGSRQSMDTVARSSATQDVVERRSGREQSFGVNADT